MCYRDNETARLLEDVRLTLELREIMVAGHEERARRDQEAYTKWCEIFRSQKVAS